MAQATASGGMNEHCVLASNATRSDGAAASSFSPFTGRNAGRQTRGGGPGRVIVMSTGTNLKDEIVSRCCVAIEANKELLTRLDQAVGDGDHGVNMSRGFEALRRAYDENREKEFPKLCQSLGMALVMNVGGASGPLFGSMIVEFGVAASSFPQTQEEVLAVFSAGIEAVKKRGKSDVGAKTMLDVLVPVRDVLGVEGVSLREIRDHAANALAKTKEMVATKGRSAFLGERTVGHVDPGAQSSCLLIQAVCDAVGQINEG